ncbi:MAG: histidine kinase N-terminal 7TM domain-containing protein [Firmicutes bacterium]|nr:histidine kinase N-terminal 7TM domain-containing protein [Bacillota bacterium]
MTKEKKKTILTFSAVSLTILLAFSCRLIGQNEIFTPLSSLIRSFLYIGLYTAWGISVYTRIVQVKIRRYLSIEAVLMVAWQSLRTVKYLFSSDYNTSRYLWYMYYLPMLFIPMFSVFIALSIGKPEEHKLAGQAYLLYIPTAILLLMVLTNDFHQLVFVFKSSEWTDHNYSYGFCYWIIIGWAIFCALTAIILFFVKCRIPKTRKILWTPFIPLAAAITYCILYLLRIEWLIFFAADITSFLCLTFTAIFESCLRCGLIQSNTGYDALFPVSSLRAFITDTDYNICYSSSESADLPVGTMRATEREPVRLNRNTLLKGHPIRAGHVIWQEDVAELADTLEQLDENNKAIAASNEVERENYQINRRIATLHERNRLYDLINTQTTRSYELLKVILDDYENCREDEEAVRKILSKTAVIGAYIKRRGNLILLSENETALPIKELKLCLNESIQNLELLGIKCEYTIRTTSSLPIAGIIRIYDLFEKIVESGIDSLIGLWIHISERDGSTVARMEAFADANYTPPANDDSEFHTGEDGSFVFVLRLPKEGEQGQ